MVLVVPHNALHIIFKEHILIEKNVLSNLINIIILKPAQKKNIGHFQCSVNVQLYFNVISQ